MNDSGQKACVFGGLVVAMYGIYVAGVVATGEKLDGAPLFAAGLASLVGVGGYVIGAMRTKEKA